MKNLLAKIQKKRLLRSKVILVMRMMKAKMMRRTMMMTWIRDLALTGAIVEDKSHNNFWLFIILFYSI
jgi:hypothetical protein